MRYLNSKLNCELCSICFSKSRQCDALCGKCFGPETLMSAFLESLSGMPRGRLRLNIFPFCDKKLCATFINLRGLYFVFNTHCEAPSMIQILVCLFKPR